ncbi:MAG: L-aspartate oxidase [Rhizobiales bacterium]|nr:L-aspartate oxidase [Hyphomicrobiales bacterium]
MSDHKIIIIGAGLAGLFCALKLLPQKSTILSIADLGKGASSAWAQGGIAAAVGNDDTPQSHVQDTAVAGAGIVDIESATMMANAAKARIDDLIELGVNFDRDNNGNLILNKEAAHSKRRVVRIGGDMAGKEIMSALIAAVKTHPNIKILENTEAIDIQVGEGGIEGIIIRNCHKDHMSEPYTITADAVIMASGGIGQLFKITTNPTAARGDGFAMAARAGATIADPEFVQFHPTAFDIGRDPAPLATEALRGEGATLINENGTRFMQNIHPDAELAPRDIVARAVFMQQVQGHKTFLDCREAIGKHFKHNFSKVYGYCQSANIDPEVDPLPILPAAHYHMGGILIDDNGKTNVQGLWACGEVSSSGVHGANRLASNSLLEAIVYAANIAKNVTQHFKSNPISSTKTINTKQYIYKNNDALKQKLRQLMSEHVGVVRNHKGLIKALKQIDIWQSQNQGHYPLVNMLDVAKMVTVAALLREESRGGHFRDDYPEADEKQAKRNYYTFSALNIHAKNYLQ